MTTLVYQASQLLCCKPTNGRFKRGNELNDINLLEHHSIVIQNDIIADISNKFSKFDFNKFDLVINAQNSTILPGFIDPHTHLIFAGSREDEFEQITAGKTYEEIAQAGGGINRTVKATRAATKDELKQIANKRLKIALSFGITTMEVKSGYGLDFETEIKILEIINELQNEQPIDLLATFLGAHTIPSEYKNNREKYVQLIIEKVLPEISQKKLAKFCDVFLETTAFSPQETKEILIKAKQLGFIPKIHSNQFNSIGGIDLAIELDVKSVDHLEVIDELDIKKLAQTEIVATILPGVSYFLKIPFAPARKMIDEGCIVAIGTDFNPGSCTTQNIQLVLNMATLYNGMKLNETINAATINSAFALGIENKVGSIEIGKQADLQILDTSNYKNLVYYFGNSLTKTVIKKGKVIYERNN